MSDPTCVNDTCKHPVTVWSRENHYSSQQALSKGQEAAFTKTVEIELPKGASSLCGKYTCAKSDIAFDKLLSCPTPTASGLTRTPCFATTFSYYMVDKYVRFLSDKLDIDLHTVRETPREHAPKSRAHRILPINPAILNFNNAFYMPSDEDLNFGDGMGALLFATDGDIVLHETSHWVIDMVNPKLAEGSFGAGYSIHEGCADVLPALFFGDAQIAEDIGFIKNPWGTMHGLRTVNNSTTFPKLFGGKSIEMDPHIIGKVYSGFWWSVSKKLEKLLKKSNPSDYRVNRAKYNQLARHATMKLVINHIAEYKPGTMQFSDFRDASIRSARSLIKAGVLFELTDHGVDLASIERVINSEAKARGIDFIIEQETAVPSKKVATKLVVSERQGRTIAYKALQKFFKKKLAERTDTPAARADIKSAVSKSLRQLKATVGKDSVAPRWFRGKVKGTPRAVSRPSKVWHYKVGPASIAVARDTGEVVSLTVRGLVD